MEQRKLASMFDIDQRKALISPRIVVMNAQPQAKPVVQSTQEQPRSTPSVQTKASIPDPIQFEQKAQVNTVGLKDVVQSQGITFGEMDFPRDSNGNIVFNEGKDPGGASNESKQIKTMEKSGHAEGPGKAVNVDRVIIFVLIAVVGIAFVAYKINKTYK